MDKDEKNDMLQCGVAWKKKIIYELNKYRSKRRGDTYIKLIKHTPMTHLD
jgi:hypothetical protein